MWCRIFCLKETAPEPNALADGLRKLGYAVEEVKTDADELGWFHLELTTSAGAFILDRYLADEGIRGDLNSWAAWLEEHAGVHAGWLMQHMIGTRQLITLRRDDRGDDEVARSLSHQLAIGLAAETGVYQIDGEGFFDHGTRLVSEEP